MRRKLEQENSSENEMLQIRLSVEMNKGKFLYRPAQTSSLSQNAAIGFAVSAGSVDNSIAEHLYWQKKLPKELLNN